MSTAKTLLLSLLLLATANAFTLDNIGLDEIKNLNWRLPAGEIQTGIDGRNSTILTVEGFSRPLNALNHCYTPNRYAITQPNPARFGNNSDPYLNDLPTNSLHTNAGFNGGHGTMVAGILCAQLPDYDYYGVAPNATIWSINTDGRSTNLSTWFSTLKQPLIITNSHALIQGERQDLQFSIDLPDDLPALIVMAAGNDRGDVLATDPTTEAQPILRVAGATWDKTRPVWWASTPGRPSTYPDISAAGCNISIRDPIMGANIAIGTTEFEQFMDAICPRFSPSANERASFTLFGGSSGAAPYVAGVAGLLLQVNPDLSPIQLKSIIIESSDPFMPTADIDNDGRISPQEFFIEHGAEAGYGYLNASVAVGTANLLAFYPDYDIPGLVVCARNQLPISSTMLNSDLGTCARNIQKSSLPAIEKKIDEPADPQRVEVKQSPTPFLLVVACLVGALALVRKKE